MEDGIEMEVVEIVFEKFPPNLLHSILVDLYDGLSDENIALNFDDGGLVLKMTIPEV